MPAVSGYPCPEQTTFTESGGMAAGPGRGWRRLALPVLLILIAYTAGCGANAGRAAASGATEPRAVAKAARPAAGPRPSATPTRGADPSPARLRYPEVGSGRWKIAPGDGPVAGEAGTLLRYRVAVEREIEGATPSDIAAEVDAALSDPRGWTGGGRWRLRRVGPGQPYDFTVYLTTPATRQQMCSYAPDRYTSCRNGNAVVINVARWVHGVPHYGVSMSIYRQYVVNHEVGHRLGRGHERCPGRGKPAPVMQQQTLGLYGCKANAWPFPDPDGREYRGPAGSYNN